MPDLSSEFKKFERYFEELMDGLQLKHSDFMNAVLEENTQKADEILRGMEEEFEKFVTPARNLARRYAPQVDFTPELKAHLRSCYATFNFGEGEQS